MQVTPGPIVPRRRIAAELRRLREEADLHLDQVAEQLLISTSKLSRLENAQGSPQARDVRDLIRLYGVEDTPVADRLMRWVRAARRQGWWNDYSSAIDDAGFNAHIAYESEAQVARVYTIPFIPALLQTAAYTKALYQAMEPWHDAATVDRLVELRMRRQDGLRAREAQPPLELVAVAYESCLHQRVGGDEVMREQLNALAEANQAENVELRILPFTAVPPFTVACMYACFEFSDSFDQDVVAVETHAGFRLIESVEQVSRYRKYHDEVRRRALDPAQSVELIKKAAATFR